MAIFTIKDLMTPKTPQGAFIALDTNVLIQLTDTDHSYYEYTRALFYELRRHRSDLKIIYFLASKLELQEYWRRRSLTLFLASVYDQSPHLIDGKGSADHYARKILEANGAGLSIRDHLSDRQIKQLRYRCLRDHAPGEGLKIWTNICKLSVQLSMAAFQRVLHELHIRYASLTNKDLFPDDPPHWKAQEDIMGHFAMGSHDAAIINMCRAGSNLFGVVSNDSDLIEFLRIEEFSENVHCFTFRSDLIDTLKADAS